MGFRYATGRLYKPKAVGFSPTDISGCLLWIDFSDSTSLFTDDGITNVSSDEDFIYRANDKSGNSNNAIQTNASLRPFWKTNKINGLSTSQNTTADTTAAQLILTSAITAADVTIFTVLNWTSTGYAYFIATPKFGNYTGTTMAGYISARKYFGSTTLSLNTPYLLTIGVGYGDNLQFYLNGQDDLNGTYSVTSTNNILYLLNDDGGSAHKGNVGEMIIYNKYVSESERTAVEAYLNNKWAIY